MSKRLYLLVGSALLVLLGRDYTSAQIDRSGDLREFSVGTTANYRFAEPNELTITVMVLGAVGKPGRYEISRFINLLDLIGLAGGWVENSDISDVALSRFVQTRRGLERRDIYFDLTETRGLKEEYLTLQPGDIVSIPFSTSLRFGEIIGLISALGVVLYSAVLLTR